MTKAEWSGWAQALGATAALGITLFLWRHAASMEDARARKLAIAFAVTAFQSLHSIQRARDLNAQSIHAAQLAEAIEVGKSVDLSLLRDARMVGALIAMRGLCEAALEGARAMRLGDILRRDPPPPAIVQAQSAVVDWLRRNGMTQKQLDAMVEGR